MPEKNFWTDKNLSWKAKGLLAYLLNVNAKATIRELITTSKDQRTAVHTGLAELKSAGYLQRFPVRDELGRFETYANEATATTKTIVKEVSKEEETSK